MRDARADRDEEKATRGAATVKEGKGREGEGEERGPDGRGSNVRTPLNYRY